MNKDERIKNIFATGYVTELIGLGIGKKFKNIRIK